MKVKILKNASFALDGKFVVQLIEGEVREFSDAQCARLVEIGFAESVSNKAPAAIVEEEDAPPPPKPVTSAEEAPKKRGRRSKRG